MYRYKAVSRNTRCGLLFIHSFIYFFFRWTSDAIWLTFRVETSSANIRAKGGRKLEVLLGNTEVQVFIQEAVCNPQGA